MRNVLLIIRREYLVRVRTKAFIIFTLLMPLLIGAVVLLPGKLMMSGSGTRHIVIVSSDPVLAGLVQKELAASRNRDDEEMPPKNAKDEKPDFEVSVQTPPTEVLRRQLIRQIRDGSIDGVAWIDPDAITTRKCTYYSRNATDFVEASMVSRALRFALSQRQLAERGFSGAQSRVLLGPADIDTVHVDRKGSNKSNGMGAFFLPFLLLFGIYMTVLIYGLYVMRSVMEEKTSRIIEVLLSSVTPMQLMAGKIIGVGAVGLTQIAIWVLSGSLLGTGSMAIARQLIGSSMKDAHVSASVLWLFPVFFVLGYATYACLYAAIGAMVNSDEEAQQMQFPVTLPLILCMVFATSIIRDPNTPLAFWLSMFPLTSPIIMFLRTAVDMPPVWQVALSIGVSLVSLYILVWLTSRIYRVGILMYGKRPTLPEILKWIRYA